MRTCFIGASLFGAFCVVAATSYPSSSLGATQSAVLPDKTRPTATITAPAKAQAISGGTNSLFSVKGTAADGGGVATVMWQLNGGTFAQADSTNNWKTWSAWVTLATGPNTVRAYSVDLSGNVSLTQSVAFTYAAVGVPIAVFAKDPANLGLGYKAVSGTWYYLDALEGLYNVSPAKGASVAMQVSVTGPGILSFGWELDGGDGTNALTCVVGTKTLGTNKTDGVALLSSVAVPAGVQTVKWTVTRGKVSGEAKGIIRKVSWTPLGKADTPTPDSGQVMMRRNFEGLSWQSLGAAYCRVYAGLSATVLAPVGAGVNAVGAVPVADMDALIGQAAGKAVYWRVDTVLQDANGNETVNTGPVWTFVALPEGSPEFTAVPTESAKLMMGVKYVLGPYEVAGSGSGTLSCAVKAGSLPAGMALMVSNGVVYVSGVPSKTGSYQAVVQLSMKTGAVTAPGTTASLSFSVGSLPLWAVGTFNGYAGDASLGCGSASMTVTEQGKITGKIAIAGSNFTFSAAAYMLGAGDNELVIQATPTTGKASLPLLTLTVLAPASPEDPEPAFAPPQPVQGIFNTKGSIILYRYVWKDAGTAVVATNCTGYYTAALPGGVDFGSGYLTFTVDKAGGVKTAGKLADGTAVSLSGSLILDETGRFWTVVYTAPVAYKGGSYFGLVEFVRPEGGGAMIVRPLETADASSWWVSFDPKATRVYEDGGFQREMGLWGGWYNTLINLREYYSTNGLTVSGVELPTLLATVKYTDYDWDSVLENPPKISWTEDTEVDFADASPNGLTLSVVPATGIGIGLSGPPVQTPSKVSTDPDTGEPAYNYGDLANPSGLTITSFVRATGIFKGSFNVYYDYMSAEDDTTEKQSWAHVAKKASYEGVLTPVREDMSSRIEGSGFFLLPETALYDTGNADRSGADIWSSYIFTGSHDFLLALP